MHDDSFFTRAVHAGEDLREHYGAISAPIYNASTFAFADADEAFAVHNREKDGYFYGRLGNPTQAALERAMCELEGGEAALAFASGMAAVAAAVLAFVKSGDHLVAPESHYSTTGLFFRYLEENFNVTTTYVDADRAENYEEAVRANTRVLYLETPSNPTLKITDIAQVSEIARRSGAAAVVDNTFATPFNQTPLALGADAVVHSATKYLGGHSDLTAGIMVGGRETIERAFQTTIKLFGASVAPQTAWLALRGIKTLALRMERHNENAQQIAEFLNAHPKVAAVNYPGLPSHPNHETATKQMRGFGGMISFDVGSVEAGRNFLNGVKLCALATSLGGVETIVQHSASMTHANVPRESRLKAGIADGLIRLSVGVEYAADIIADLDGALKHI